MQRQANLRRGTGRGGQSSGRYANRRHEHFCAATTAGRIWCWGENRVGQLGRGFSSGRKPVGLVVAAE
ncbi:MAG: hypothetical protein JW751_28325 [Polyangiaceae bacterium]|nr:hypothetical protein [Polyangiaceae bacterium]